MKLMISLLSVGLMISTYCYAQCPPETALYFSTQQQLDDFAAEYPDCEAYEGYVQISWESISAQEAIVNLAPLGNLWHIGNLHLKDDSEGHLNGFEGLESLEVLDRMTLENLCCISDFTGFESLDTIRGEVRLWNMESLTSLEGSAPLNLGSILTMRNNPNLIDIDALSFYTDQLGQPPIWMEVINNPNLTNYNCLWEASEIGYSWKIEGQDDISYLENVKTVNGISITGNEFVTDISALKNYMGGNSLYLENLSDLENLDALADIQLWNSLTVINCPMADIPVFTMRSPRQFHLVCADNPNLESLSLLKGEPELREISLNNCPKITNLDDLSELQIIQYHLKLDTLIGLNNLSGLSKLTTIDRDFYFTGNPLIENFRGMESLTNIGYDFQVRDNSSLENFEGLKGLRNIGYRTHVELNPLLRSFDGLSVLINDDPLVGAPYFYIRENPELISIQDLKNIQTHYTFRISYNPKLGVCHIPPVCFALMEDDHAYVRNNAFGCHMDEHVLDLCAELPSAIDDLKENNFRIYPNPVYDYLYIFSGEESVDAVDIFDINGRIILSDTFKPSIKVSQLSSGVYFIKMGNEIERFVKL